jgi:hypothetical protein
MKRDISEHSTGWWVAGLLMKNTDPGVAPYWNNIRIFKAGSWREAFRKAEEAGRSEQEPTQAFAHQQEFVGISDLVPVYEDFEDGSELIWQEIRSGEELPRVYTIDDLKAVFE